MRHKINLRLALIALLAILTTAIGVTLVYYNLFQTQVKNDLRESARLLKETEVFQNAYLDETKRNDLVHLTSKDLRITWIDGDGTVLFDNDTPLAGLSNHLDRPEIQEALRDGYGESVRQSDTLNMSTYYHALLLENGTVLRVSTRARTIFSLLLSALPVIFSILVLVLFMCILIGHLLVKLLMKPMEEMADNLDDINRVPLYPELKPFAEKIRSQHENILSAEKSRQDFTANVTHELKTPITAISGYAELIENGLVDGEETTHIASSIRHNADRLLSLITDIIQLSELDHKELPRTFLQLDLLRLAKECVEAMKPIAEKRSITLEAKGTEAWIHGEEALVREMVENLVQNAIRYNREKGSVLVSVTMESDHPVLTVKDTGIGISPREQQRVFERFYRVDKSRSRETGGTGLGLAIVKHIVDLHNAEIKLESTLGVGTEVKVIF